MHLGPLPKTDMFDFAFEVSTNDGHLSYSHWKVWSLKGKKLPLPSKSVNANNIWALVLAADSLLAASAEVIRHTGEMRFCLHLSPFPLLSSKKVNCLTSSAWLVRSRSIKSHKDLKNWFRSNYLMLIVCCLLFLPRNQLYFCEWA